jgi:glycosyltransferase involved in cell wall biosynthesis
MNVLVISQMYPNTANNVSGIFVHEQVLALMKKGINVMVVSPAQWIPFYIGVLPRKWESIRDIPAEDQRESVQVFHPRYLSIPNSILFSTSGYMMYRGIKDKVKEIRKSFEFDIIHAHAAIPNGYAAMLLSRELDIPYVVTIHGSDFYNSIHRNQILKKQVEAVIRNSSNAIVVSDVLRKIGEQSLRGIAPLITINNGLTPERVIAQPVDIRKLGEERIILSVANLKERKGIQDVIFAVARLIKEISYLKYIIVGDGPYRFELERLTHELGLAQQIVFVGQQEYHKTMQFMAACDIFVLPSWDEAFGVVYIEAMANAKPVIGCMEQGIEDIVMDSVTGFLVKPRDIDDLVRVLADLLNQPEKGIEVGRRAQRHVLENFTWEKNAREMIRIYKECIDASNLLLENN